MYMLADCIQTVLIMPDNIDSGDLFTAVDRYNNHLVYRFREDRVIKIHTSDGVSILMSYSRDCPSGTLQRLQIAHRDNAILVGCAI